MGDVERPSTASGLAEQLRRLQRVTRALAEADSPEAVADVVVDEVLPALGAAGIAIALVEDDGPPRLRVLRAAGYGAIGDTVREIPLDAGLPLSEAARRGEPVLLSSSVERLVQFPSSRVISPVHESLAAFPLVVAGRALGALGISFAIGRPFSDDDRAFIGTIALQCAVALERCRLQQAERARRDEAESSANRLRRLQALSRGLSAALTVDDVATVTGEVATADLKAVSVGMWRLDQRRRRLRLVPHFRLGTDSDQFAIVPLDARLPAAEAARTGEPVFVADKVERDERYPGLGARSSVASSFTVLPLVVEGAVTGVLALGFEDEEFSDDTRRFLSSVADLCAQALDRARLYDNERRARSQAESDRAQIQQLAQALQTSLLPPELPDIAGADLAARYHPALSGVEVGGDFYDVFDTGGDWALVIGDVCGKGPDAAAITAIARYTLRSVAMDMRQPADVLRKLNDALIHQQLEERFCTVAYGRAVPTARGMRITVCRGGHPSPMVVRAGGEVAPIGAAGGLIGALPDIRLWEETVQLEAGDAIVFYTDGVTEARVGRDLFGEDRVAATLASCAGRPAVEMAEALERAVIEYGGREPTDDIAILVLRVTP